MTTLKVVGKNSGEVVLDLPQARPEVLHEVVVWQLAKRRMGTASTKTRSAVMRSGKKLYSQKGTGNARHGDRGAPIFVGGGVAHGPKPRDYAYTLPRKVRALGLKMAVSDRAKHQKMLVVSGWDIEAKTKVFLKWAADHGLTASERVFLVTDDESVLRAARNLPWVTAVKAAGMNVYDILRHEWLVIDKSALDERLALDVNAGGQQ